MATLNGFDAQQVEPHTPFEPLPAGKYVAAITESQMKPTKDGTGSYLQLTFTLLEGPHKGRMAWARLCLNHSNPQTVKIARAELSAVCRAVGVMQPKDSCELHNIPLLIKVVVKRRSDVDELTNEVRGYEPKSVAAGVPQQAVPTGSNTPPWRR